MIERNEKMLLGDQELLVEILSNYDSEINKNNYQEKTNIELLNKLSNIDRDVVQQISKRTLIYTRNIKQLRG